MKRYYASFSKMKEIPTTEGMHYSAVSGAYFTSPNDNHAASMAYHIAKINNRGYVQDLIRYDDPDKALEAISRDNVPIYLGHIILMDNRFWIIKEIGHPKLKHVPGDPVIILMRKKNRCVSGKLTDVFRRIAKKHNEAFAFDWIKNVTAFQHEYLAPIAIGHVVTRYYTYNKGFKNYHATVNINGKILSVKIG